ncbi:MAG TPA: thiosulfate oxidation carrier protein SoxY [Burkholderiales bacterium]
MNSLRRSLLGALLAALCKPLAALAAAWNKEAFGAKSAAEALKGIGAAGAVPSAELLIDAPQIAENGAVVPVEITSNIAGTTSIAVVIEKNPFPLAGVFEFKDGALPFVRLNLKIGESSDVRVIAEAGGRRYSASQEIKVTIGGCGG